MGCYNLHHKKLNGKILEYPCGKCVGCLQTQRAEWTFRLLQEAKASDYHKFITLTYQDNWLLKNPRTGLPEIRKSEVQKFIKLVRKNNDKKLKYFFIGEYGGITKRPHYHGILFHISPKIIENINEYWINYDNVKKEKSTKGNVHVGDVNNASIHYLTKYMISRRLKRTDKQPEFRLLSKNLGSRYLDYATNYHKNRLDDTAFMEGGYKIQIPRFFKDKIFTDDEKEEISFNKRTKIQKHIREAIRDKTDNCTSRLEALSEYWNEVKISQTANERRIVNSSKSTKI